MQAHREGDSRDEEAEEMVNSNDLTVQETFMAKDDDVVVTLEFTMPRKELEDFVEENGNVDDWAFGEICQNHDFGMLTGCQIKRATA